MSHYEIIVGNIGTVLTTKNKRKAARVYQEYVRQSKANLGRCAGEPVTFFQDDNIAKEYDGTNSSELAE